MVRSLVLILVGVIIGAMASCGAVRGFGQFLGGAGSDFVNAADWVQDHNDNGWKRLDERTK